MTGVLMRKEQGVWGQRHIGGTQGKEGHITTGRDRSDAATSRGALRAASCAVPAWSWVSLGGAWGGGRVGEGGEGF